MNWDDLAFALWVTAIVTFIAWLFLFVVNRISV
jgi:hypothetical protein